jgi:hypothetical protein
MNWQGIPTPVLTARYSHRRLYDLASAVEKLPSFLPTGDEGTGEAAQLTATGTDGAAFGCLLVAHGVSNQGHSTAPAGNKEEEESLGQQQHNPLICQRVASPGISGHQRGRRDSNPQPPDRQSRTYGLRARFRHPSFALQSLIYQCFASFPAQ